MALVAEAAGAIWFRHWRTVREHAARYGAAGKARFKPSTCEPLLIIFIDELRWVLKRWPGIVQDLLWVTGQGRSFGICVFVIVQKGDASAFGGIAEIRSKIMGGGYS
ncbi:MAG TPA: hypothetical protein VI248_03355 [Kineosporiaceae bacterium]